MKCKTTTESRDRDERNLLAETREYIEDCGLSPENIVFIGSRTSGHRCTWEEFKQLADEFYNTEKLFSDENPPGAVEKEVANDLEIVFMHGETMFRSYYDDTECWKIIRPYQLPTLPKKRIFTLFGKEKPCKDQPLSEINSQFNMGDRNNSINEIFSKYFKIGPMGDVLLELSDKEYVDLYEIYKAPLRTSLATFEHISRDVRNLMIRYPELKDTKYRDALPRRKTKTLRADHVWALFNKDRKWWALCRIENLYYELELSLETLSEDIHKEINCD